MPGARGPAVVQPKISAIEVLSGKDKFVAADEIVKRAVQKGLGRGQNDGRPGTDHERGSFQQHRAARIRL